MYLNGELISNNLISKTHVFGLLSSAVVSMPVVVPINSYKLLRPGTHVKFKTEDPNVATLECVILDVESIKKPEGDAFTVRITIQLLKNT